MSAALAREARAARAVALALSAQSSSPLERKARQQVLTGVFGDGASDDRARWWLQELGLVTGRELTDAGHAVRKALHRLEREARHGAV